MKVVTPTQINGLDSGVYTPPAKSDSKALGKEFASTLAKFEGNIGLANQFSPISPAVSGGLKFSNHAIERMTSRGIHFSKEDLSRIDQAIERAQKKGSRDTLLLMEDSALIVSVKNKTVVTVMDKANLKENVFTNIDSTIVM